jgi:hypothetical protein
MKLIERENFEKKTTTSLEEQAQNPFLLIKNPK